MSEQFPHPYESQGMVSTTALSSSLHALDVESSSLEITTPDANDTTTSPPTTTATRAQRRRYECLACWIYFGTAFGITHAIPWKVHERPLPVQFLPNSGDYVVSPLHNEPLRHETVSDAALVLTCGLAPVLVQYLLATFWPATARSENQPTSLSSMESRHATLCAYLTANATNTAFTEFVKLYCGVLRPIFWAVCQPNDTYDACTNPSQSELDDARKSFPSGHASQAFVGLGLLAWYLSLSYRKIGLMPLVPMALAVWIAASRVRDNRHFPADVITGAVIGGTVATYFHTWWFH